MQSGQNPILPIGSIFQEGYEVLAELGTGSFGRVYKARQLSTGQEVAIKILRLREGTVSADIDNRIERFRREMRLCAELAHPNIVGLIDSGESAEGVLYAVFEFVPGSTLKDVVAAEGKLSLHETVYLMSQVLDALSCAHARGVVHRDLKPENIMITKTGARRNALVLDFGLGGFASDVRGATLPRITATQEFLGTPCYAAPEQLRGEPPSARSDLYSWGLILLECLTGDLPVRGASAQEVICKQLGPEPVAIPSWLRRHALGRVLEVVTAKQAGKRDVAIERLLHILGSMGITESVPPEPGLDRRLVERERRQLTILCCRITVSARNNREADIEEVDQLLRTEREALAERAAFAGGVVAAMFADRIYLLFGYPQAHEDDARRAALLGMEIAGTAAQVRAGEPGCDAWRVEIRIGVHTGLLIVPDLGHGGGSRMPELTGVTPQIASRLAERAQPGEVLVSPDTYRLLREEIAAEPAGECELPELSSRLPIFRLELGRPPGTTSLSAADESPLVARAAQLEQLMAGWSDSCARRGRAVLLSGEAGIGKSRLLREVRRRVPVNAWVECRCAPENQSAALRPVIESLFTISSSLEVLLTRYNMDLAETLPLFAALLSQPPDQRFPPLQISPERQKELTLQALVTLLFKMARERPIVFAIENLHWADPTTIELLTLLAQELSAACRLDFEPGPMLYLLLTARPEFVPPWFGEDVTLLPLPRLGTAEVQEMVTAGLAGGQAVASALVAEVVRRAEGVPLFVEELARLLLDPQYRDAVGWTGGRLARSIEIPTSLRDLLTARLDLVSSAARETAHVAAVLGREFQYTLLRAVSAKDEAALREDLIELARAGLLYRSRFASADSYLFRHALIRDAAYAAMTRATCRNLHHRVAQVLRKQFAHIERQRPELIAQHLEYGGEIEAAIGYWFRAGSQSYGRAAYTEARTQLEHALDLLRGLPPSPARERQEVEVLLTLGTLLMMTRGWAAAEVEEVFSRAMSLCEQLGGDVPPGVLYGLWSVQITRSNPGGVDALIPHMQALTRRTDQLLAAHMGHACLGAEAFWRGDFTRAHEQLAEARRYSGSAQRFAYDGRLYSYALDAWILWVLGYADQAEILRAEAFDIARTRGDPYSMAIALAYGSMLAHDRGDIAAAEQWATQLVTLANEQHLGYWVTTGMYHRGLALVRQGRMEEGLQLIREGTERTRSIGVLSSYGYCLLYLTEAELAADRIAPGLAVAARGLDLCTSLVARFHEPELLRLRGLLHARAGDRAAAESDVQRALELSERRAARGYALRAAIALAQLPRHSDRAHEGAAALRRIYGQFSEGYETRDLKMAAVILSSAAAS